jgi:uncharacterized protein (DUF488 family)
VTASVYTIGHSTHPPAELVKLLQLHAIEQVADIRSVARSRRHPQFGSESLARWLPEHGISYEHFPRLGGWRRPVADSPNGAWRNRSFRGYADYALSSQFARAIEEILASAAARRTAMMCSEALWWRCHRRLVADRMVIDGGAVDHIGSDGRLSRHALTSFAAVDEDGRIIYPHASDRREPASSLASLHSAGALAGRRCGRGSVIGDRCSLEPIQAASTYGEHHGRQGGI